MISIDRQPLHAALSVTRVRLRLLGVGVDESAPCDHLGLHRLPQHDWCSERLSDYHWMRTLRHHVGVQIADCAKLLRHVPVCALQLGWE